MKIITQLKPNNRLVIKKFRLADGFCRPPVKGDNRATRERLRVGKALEELTSTKQLLRSLSQEECYTRATEEIVQLPIPGSGNTNVQSVSKSYRSIPYCPIDNYIHVAEEVGKDSVNIVQTSYEEIAWVRRRALDTLENSQQTKQAHSSWGQPQKEKTFGWSAGQKILEGGAIIDRFCGAENSHMLTLTLPGNTPVAMDALARWSGWIVNRILQVVRRKHTVENPIYWFFVWEHQKRGALHMHFCLGWRVPPEIRELLGKEIIQKFYRCLHEIGAKESIDLFARKGFSGSWKDQEDKWQWDCQQVTKSVAHYFAKYAKKNAEYTRNNGDKQDKNGRKQCFARSSSSSHKRGNYPTRYWGSSKTIKVWTKFLTRKVAFESVGSAEDDIILRNILATAFQYHSPESVHHSSFEIVIPESGIVISSGDVWVFSIVPSEYPSFWAHCMDAIIERSHGDDDLFRTFMESE